MSCDDRGIILKLEGDGPIDQRCTQPQNHLWPSSVHLLLQLSARFVKFRYRFSQPVSTFYYRNTAMFTKNSLCGCIGASEVSFDSGFGISDLSYICGFYVPLFDDSQEVTNCRMLISGAPLIKKLLEFCLDIRCPQKLVF